MVCATIMNSKRTQEGDKLWRTSDFIDDGSAPESDSEPRMQSAEEIYALMMHYMPPQIQ